MKKITFLFLIIILSVSQPVFPQENTHVLRLDSISTLLKKDKQDTLRVVHLLAYANEVLYENPDTVIILAKQALEIITPVPSVELSKQNSYTDADGIGFLKSKVLSVLGEAHALKAEFYQGLEYLQNALIEDKRLNYEKGIAADFQNIASIYDDMNLDSMALNYSRKSLEIQTKIGNKDGVAISFNQMGIIYLGQGNYSQALEYFYKSLKISEEIGDKQGISYCFSNIGSVYQKMRNYSKALEYCQKGLQVNEDTGDSNGRCATLGKIGNVYYQMKEYKQSIEYYSKAMEISREMGNDIDVAMCLDAIAASYQTMKEYSKAETFQQQALVLRTKANDELGVAESLNNIGTLYAEAKKDYKKAGEYLLKSEKMLMKYGAPDILIVIEENLSEIYDSLGLFKEALIHFKKSVEIKDTLLSQENRKQLVAEELNYQFEKKQADVQAKHDKELILAEEEKAKQKVVIYSVLAGSLLIAAFAGVVLYSLQLTRKQKRVIEQQNDEITRQKEIAEKQKEKIVDSINYARGIQQSILPEITEIKKYFPESFILYLPKDIVSGDFYWFSKKNDKLILAAADCTGHGVPGAFMSMIGNTLLNQIVNEKNITTPSEILNVLNNGVINALHQNYDAILSLDGMDIAVCTVDYTGKEIQFAGALSPLYLIQDEKIIVINGDKFGIGGDSKLVRKYNDTKKEFTNHVVAITENMSIYLFSDGYMDQFKEADRKKFGKQNFQELLLKNKNQSMAEQKHALLNAHNQWKGNLSQIDDIMVIGIKL